MSKQVRVTLPDELHAKVKARAVLDDATIAAWIAAAIEAALAKKPKKKAKAKA